MGDTRKPTPPGPQSPDLASFELILLKTQGSLFGFVRNLTGDEEEARDLVQEVYVDAWRAAERGKPPFTSDSDEVACRRWLFHVAYCHVISALRRRSIIAWESLDPPTGRTPIVRDGQASFEERLVEEDSLRTALQTLDPPDIACLLLRVVEGCSSVEIAQILDIAPDAARKRLSRAMRRLRAAYFAQEEYAQ